MTDEFIAVAIDGPAASGKSTIAKRIAKELGLVMISTGSMYRAVAWASLQKGVDPNDKQAVIAMLDEIEIDCGIENGQSTVGINGQVLGDELKSEAVNAHVSIIAAVPEVRQMLVKKQRDYRKYGHIVMEGRDIGSVVFPNTPFKIYIDASEEVRMARRSAEGGADTIAERDKQDSNRKFSPLTVAEGATVIDTTEMSIDEVLVAVKQALREQGAPAQLFE